MSNKCNCCGKTEPEVTLRRCAKCSVTRYCSRDCQKADWKGHRKECGKQSPNSDDNGAHYHGSSAGSKLSPPKGLEQAITKPFTRLGDNTWLHNRPETDVYRLLIDAYRLRVEDDYSVSGDVDQDSIYGGAPDGLKDFRRFLKKAGTRPGLLPPWWNDNKKAACENLGMDPNEWQNLRSVVKKSDLIDHYGDRFFPMQLRMFAENVIGEGPGGQDGTMMRTMMEKMESGESDEQSMLNVSGDAR